MNWLSKNKTWILRVLAVAAPVVAGVLGGGVLTVPVVMTAIGTFIGTLGKSPMNHE